MPSASLASLRLRAQLLSRIRRFFDERGVLEVETPLLSSRTTTEPHVDSFVIELDGVRHYLQSSPEHAMKRLIGAGYGSVYQISKAFRREERGRQHHPEFTILEWYRVGFGLAELMDEVGELLELVVGTPRANRSTYEAVFQRHVGANPHTSDVRDLAVRAKALGLSVANPESLDRSDWLNLLMERVIEPTLGADAPELIYDFPVCLSTFARRREGNPPVAERVEVFFRGMELANGYAELTEAAEHRVRDEEFNVARRRMGKPEMEVDERLHSALDAGFEKCSGIALGVDRLVMAAASAQRIDDVIAFPIERA
jgi:lysyl-tRNA synthetase class 2